MIRNHLGDLEDLEDLEGLEAALVVDSEGTSFDHYTLLILSCFFNLYNIISYLKDHQNEEYLT